MYTGKKAIQKAIMNTDLRGAKINGKIEIPKDWVRVKTRTGDGWEYIDPDNSFNSIRLMAKDSRSGAGPWAKIRKDGQYRNANDHIVRKSSAATHQPVYSITR